MTRKSGFVLILVLVLMLSSCGQTPKYTYHFFGSFDTMTDITAFAKNEKEFREFSAYVEKRMLELHKMFDIYHNYDGINNAKTINDNAGIKSVVVGQELLDLIILGKQWYNNSDGAVNIAMGPVLSIWHEYRELYSGEPDGGELPPMERLENAFKLCDINDVIIDEQASSVFLAKKGMSLDVGALAKGYATQLIADELSDSDVKNFLISAGGNVLTKGQPQDGNRTKWGVGIQSPFVNETDNLLDTLLVTDCSIVTSGDYQRYYMVGGKMMGHIVSPWTLMPAENFRSVTIIAKDSGIADLLSTALFILPYDKGLDLVTKNGAEAVWAFADGTIKATDGAKADMKSLSNASSTK